MSIYIGEMRHEVGDKFFVNSERAAYDAIDGDRKVLIQIFHTGIFARSGMGKTTLIFDGTTYRLAKFVRVEVSKE